jgi:hypothetical protein
MQEGTPADGESLWGDSDWAVDAPANEASRKAQEDTWAKTVKTVDGRAHFSDREASHLHGDKLRRTVADYHSITALVDGLLQKGGACLLTQLGAELVEHIVEIIFPGQGSIVLSLFEQLQLPPIDRSESHFRLCVRKRPLLQFELAAGEYNVVDTHPARTSLCCHDGKLARSGRRMTMTHRFYSCDRVWAPAASNASVYESEVQPLLKWSLAAPANASTLLCYGQTGTGKTYTLMGMLEHLARDLSSRNFGVEVLFFEVHGKKCYDLLADRAIVHLRSDQDGRVHVRGAKRLRLLPPTPEGSSEEGEGVKNTASEDKKGKRPQGSAQGSAVSPRADGAARLMEVLRGALALRMTEATERNPISSRSHAVCELRMLRWREEGEEPDEAEATEAEVDPEEMANGRLKSQWQIPSSQPTVVTEAVAWFADGAQESSKPPPSPCRGKLHPSKTSSLVEGTSAEEIVGIDPTGEHGEGVTEKGGEEGGEDDGQQVKMLGTLRLVDLAGSERNYETTRMTPVQVPPSSLTLSLLSSSLSRHA